MSEKPETITVTKDALAEMVASAVKAELDARAPKPLISGDQSIAVNHPDVVAACKKLGVKVEDLRTADPPVKGTPKKVVTLYISHDDPKGRRTEVVTL